MCVCVLCEPIFVCRTKLQTVNVEDGVCVCVCVLCEANLMCRSKLQTVNVEDGVCVCVCVCCASLFSCVGPSSRPSSWVCALCEVLSPVCLFMIVLVILCVLRAVRTCGTQPARIPMHTRAHIYMHPQLWSRAWGVLENIGYTTMFSAYHTASPNSRAYTRVSHL